ncbi:MAG: hypothetical protein J6M39_06485 [Lachnospiraceae bacterium]|nr:hypothetical protein [Lachnospiraceae bacterium]
MVKRVRRSNVKDGVLLPLGNGFSLVKGDNPNKTDDVDIGPNNKNGLSVNHGEILQQKGNTLRVFSAEPMLGGVSPVQLLYGGMAPDKVFAMQEQYKDMHGINDDGSRQNAQFGILKKIKQSVNRHNNNKRQTPLKGIDWSGIKTTNDRAYNQEYINYINDSLVNYGYNNNQRAAILANIIEESGGDPFAEGPGGYYGLLQWGSDRYTKTKEKDVYKEIDNQLKYLHGTIGETKDKKSWTHGGKGSGYNSFTDAMAAYNSDDLNKVMHGFTWGYVRPAGKQDSYLNRQKVADQLINLEGFKFGGRKTFQLGGDDEDKYNTLLNAYNLAVQNRKTAIKTKDDIQKAFYDYQDNLPNNVRFSNTYHWRNIPKLRKLRAELDNAENNVSETTKSFFDAEERIGEATINKYKGTNADLLVYPGWSKTEEDAKKYLIKDGIRESIGAQEVADYFNSYANSPGFQRIIDNQISWGQKRHPYRKIYNPNYTKLGFSNAARQFRNTLLDKPMTTFGVFDMNSYPGMGFNYRQYAPYNHIIINAAGNPFLNQQKEQFPYWYELTHEMLHDYNFTGDGQGEALDQNKNTNSGHDSWRNEKHSDLEALRFMLYKYNIYDSRDDKDAKAEDIKKLRELFPKLRPLEQMDDETAAWMINHVASVDKTDKESKRNRAQLGGQTNINSLGARPNAKYEKQMKNKRNKSLTGTQMGAIGAGINTLGSLIGAGIQQSAINNLEAPKRQYTLLNPVKLKTKININPQIARMREMQAQIADAARRTSGSSRTAYQKMLASHNRLLDSAMDLYGRKENAETELINRDRLNQMQVAHTNATNVINAINQTNELDVNNRNYQRVATSNNWTTGLNTTAGAWAGPNGFIDRANALRVKAGELYTQAIANPTAAKLLYGDIDFTTGANKRKAFNTIYDFLNNNRFA